MRSLHYTIKSKFCTPAAVVDRSCEIVGKLQLRWIFIESAVSLNNIMDILWIRIV